MPSLAHALAFTLVALVACDPGQPPRDVTDTVAGVRYTIRLPASYVRETTFATGDQHVYRDPNDRFGPGITVGSVVDWPADLDHLRRRSTLPSDADQWRLEARADGFAGSRVQPDQLRTTVFVLRQDGPHRLGCDGQAGFTRTPLPNAEATRQQLMDTCESLRILP